LFRQFCCPNYGTPKLLSQPCRFNNARISNHGCEYVVRCYDHYDHAYEYFPLMYGNVEGLLCVYVHENGHEGADVNVWYLHERVHVHAHECARVREGKYVYDLDSLYPPLQVNLGIRV
jgi:hypothetical protein